MYSIGENMDMDSTQIISNFGYEDIKSPNQLFFLDDKCFQTGQVNEFILRTSYF
jgi:hypothetical protein